MRFALSGLLILAVGLAGCASPEDAAPAPGAGPGGDVKPLPESIEDTRAVTAGADPLAFLPGNPPCATQGSECIRYPFDVTVPTTIEAALTWGVAANDFDLFVFLDGAALGSEGGTSPPGTQEAVRYDLAPGSYELVVSFFAGAADTYTVSATFS